MPNTALKEFKEVLLDFRQLASLALKGAVAAPLIDLWLRVGPIPTKPVAVLSSLVEFLAVVWVFQFCRDTSERKLKIRMNAALGFFFVGMVLSLFLLWTFTVSPGQRRDRVVEGFSIRPDIKPLINTSYTAEQAIRESEYDAEKVWTKESIVAMQTAIIVIWIATFAFVAVYLTIFIILQRRHTSSPPTRRAAG
jgi:beta-lactamase regulating signal transducer with metallopeptidase domain